MNKGIVRFGGLLVFIVSLKFYWPWLGPFKLNCARGVQCMSDTELFTEIENVETRYLQRNETCLIAHKIKIKNNSVIMDIEKLKFRFVYQDRRGNVLHRDTRYYNKLLSNANKLEYFYLVNDKFDPFRGAKDKLARPGSFIGENITFKAKCRDIDKASVTIVKEFYK